MNTKLQISHQTTFEDVKHIDEYGNEYWEARELLRFKDEKTINYYLNEVENKNLTKNELISIIKSKSFERTISNQRSKNMKNSHLSGKLLYFYSSK